MKAHWTLIVGGVAALALLGGCQAAAGPVEEVVIGADLELSGALAPVGNVYAHALQMRVDQLNQDGSLGNRKLTLVLRDNQSNPATSATNIAALAADRSVRALITGACGDCVVGAAKAINADKIPTIALAVASNVATPVADRKYIFKVAPNVSDDAAVLVSELTSTNLKKYAIVGTEDQVSKDASEAFVNTATRSGLTLLGNDKVTADPEKLTAEADKLVGKKPDSIVVVAASGVAEQLTKRIRDAGYGGRILLGSAAADNLFLSGETATAMDGAQMVFTPTLVSDDIIATSPAKATRVSWFRDYLSKYGTYAAYASFAADAVNVVADAITQTGATDRETLRTAVETTRMDGLSGPIRLTPSNHSGLMPQAVTLLVAANGRWRLAS